MKEVKRDFLFIGSCKSKSGDWYAVGHIMKDDKYSLKPTWIRTNKAVCDDLKPLEVYEVEVVDMNGDFPVYDFS